MAKKEKTQEPKDEDLAIAPVPDNEIKSGAEKVEEQKRDERQTFEQIMRRFVLAVLRLIIIVAVIGGCGAAIYFGVPLIYDNLLLPVEENTTQMNDISLRQSQVEFQLMDMETRLAMLETGHSSQSDSISDLDARIQSLDADQSSLSDEIKKLDARIQTLEGADADRNEMLTDLLYQSDLLRAMELLSRARIFLYQSNFGLARADVQAAYNVLVEMQPTAPDSKQQDINEALFRIDLALENLPDFPVAASDDLDIAWQILMEGYPVPPTATPTPVLTTTPEETPIPPIDLTSTPTAEP